MRILFATTLFFLSLQSCVNNCKKDECKNGGYCVETGCKCVGSWSGKNCEVDKCASIVCTNAVCINGICSCNLGYEGANCQTEVHAKFIGDYTYSAPCVSGGRTSKIEKVGSIENLEIIIRDIVSPQSVTNSIYAKIQGQSITVNSQFLQNNVGVEGAGSISNNVVTLNLNYRQTPASSPVSCKYTLTKQ